MRKIILQDGNAIINLIEMTGGRACAASTFCYQDIAYYIIMKTIRNGFWMGIAAIPSTKETRFKIGEVVYERIRPGQKLIVSKFANNVYFCRPLEDIQRKDLVFFERELMVDVVLK